MHELGPTTDLISESLSVSTRDVSQMCLCVTWHVSSSSVVLAIALQEEDCEKFRIVKRHSGNCCYEVSHNAGGC